MTSFFGDKNFGRPKILFIGLGESTHTHAWIDLLQDTKFDARLFALPTGAPPSDWMVPTYLTAYEHRFANAGARRTLHSRKPFVRFSARNAARLRRISLPEMTDRWLANIVRTWRPDIIHTLGIDPAGEYFFRLRKSYALEGLGCWVLQTRGGSDMALMRFDDERRPLFEDTVRGADQIIFDNVENKKILMAVGVRPEQLAWIAPVPGTGGIDIDGISSRLKIRPSDRRTIVWPKAYEVRWSKALPVFEAIKLIWSQIQPCEIHMLAMNDESRMWYAALPEEVRKHCHAYERISRDAVLQLFADARIMLAPSLVDGVPNSLYEAMATGAFPIVSPLDTIRPLVEEGRNVLFANNLYPDQIAACLVRAMSDDALVDSAARENLALVKQLADRGRIRARVIEFYEQLALTH